MHVRTRVALTLVAIALAAGLAAPALAQPSRGQIAAAVKQAEGSKDLWATINVCKIQRGRLTLGIRGQMPALGFSSELSMEVRPEYLSGHKFVPIPDASATVSPGKVATGLHQDGYDFRFKPYDGVLSGEVTFTWTMAGHVVGKVTLSATSRHHDADFGNPPHFSAARCSAS